MRSWSQAICCSRRIFAVQFPAAMHWSMSQRITGCGCPIPGDVCGQCRRNASVAAAGTREAGVGRVVYTSSVATMGFRSDGTVVDEDTPVSIENMIGHYKRSKFLGGTRGDEGRASRPAGRHPEPDNAHWRQMTRSPLRRAALLWISSIENFQPTSIPV